MSVRKPELVVALDIPYRTEAFDLAEKICEMPVVLKVGWVLFPHIGFSGLCELSKMFHGRLFLDFKLHDIPSVIATGVESLMRTVDFEIITLHTSGGGNMMEQSVEKRDECFSEGSLCSKKPILLGVTVLTSMDAASLKQIGSSFVNPDDAVIELAELASNSGMDGVVSSVHEVTALKAHFGDDFKILTPGIRPEGENRGDQARVATPKEAKIMGSDYIVVGRPITKSFEPVKIVEQILHEIE